MSNPIIEKIEKLIDEKREVFHNDIVFGDCSYIKSCLSQAITELLEELAKEVIGEKINNQSIHAGGWNAHRRNVISAFKRRGIKLIEAEDFKRK